MKFKAVLVLAVLLYSCQNASKNTLIVYPIYCGGCVDRNFHELSEKNLANEFNIYFDTTDAFLLSKATLYKLKTHHIKNKKIPYRFGDYSNIVIINKKGETFELRTDETLEKGIQFN